MIVRILLFAIGLVGVASLYYFGLSGLAVTPASLYFLSYCWRRQSVGFFTRKDDPLIFWIAMSVTALAGLAGLQEYWIAIQRFTQ